MKNIVKLLIVCFLVTPLVSKPVRITMPLQNTKIIKGNGTGWNEHFFGYRENKLFSFSGSGSEIVETQIYTFSIKPEHVKFFNMLDVNVFTAWDNSKKKMEMIIFAKNDELVTSDTIELSDTVDDLDLRFGQGRRPAFLFIKANSRENKATIWFDDREQIIFLQNMPIMASTLHWAELSALIVTRSGTKPVIKAWEKGVVNVYDLPFLPIFSRLMIFDNRPILFAIDSKATLWSIRVDGGQLISQKIYTHNELAYIKKLDLLKSDKSYIIAMQVQDSKKLLVLKSPNKDFLNLRQNPVIYDLINENQVFPGLIAGKLTWLESTASDSTYVRSEDDLYQPLLNLKWILNIKEGYPEVNFTWQSLPTKGKYVFRYILDTKPISMPLPEYRLTTNSINAKLANEGNYYLHIQSQETVSQWESPIYHIPIFWKNKPDTPNISLLNEITPYVITGNSVDFIIQNISPMDYYADINNTPVFDPMQKIDPASGEVKIRQNLKPGRYYIHIRSRDPRTNEFSPTLHYLFFYQTYVTEFTVGTTEYHKDLGRLNSLINQYKNAQSTEEKEKILKELNEFKRNLELELEKKE